MNAMDDELDIARVGNEWSGREEPLEITAHPGGGDPAFSDALCQLGDALKRNGGEGVVLRRGDGGDPPALPALSFRRPAGGVIHYLALPEGREAGPFMEMLRPGPRSETASISDEIAARIHDLDCPADILVFVATACPHCPHAVRAATGLAASGPRVTVSVVDAQRYPELAGRCNVRSVPMTVVDGELLISEAVTMGDLAAKVLSRGTPAYETELLRAMVESGSVDRAAERLVASALGPEAFLLAWRKSVLNLRVGMLLAAQEALEKDASTLNGIVPGLIEVLGVEDGALRGDTADLLGQIGHPDARAPLEKLLKDENPDVVEIAEEALEGL